MFKKQQKKFNKEQKFQGEKGYQGGEKVDTQKKRNQKMSEEAKENNKRKAQKASAKLRRRTANVRSTQEKNIRRAYNKTDKNI